MMFSNLSWALMVSLVLSTEARFKMVERDGRAIFPRRFGQEQGGGIPAEIGSACDGQICGVLGGDAISKLLAGNPPCGQQDHADAIIDAAKAQTDPAITANMIRLAIAFRQLEKNTPPDFTTNPPTNRNSLFCDKAPKNAELNGLVQAQDPANDPNLFFDPVSKTTVTLGAPGTFPFGTDGAAAPPAAVDPPADDPPAATEAAETAAATATAGSTCTAPVTVTVTEGAAATGAAAATETTADTAPPAANPAPATGSLDFGSCTDPSLQFGPGFNGRKLSEFTFAPNNQAEFAQGEALNGNIVTNAICNILKDKCKASAEALTACDTGKAAFAAAFSATGSVSEKGGAADAFNAALGIQTDLATIQSAPGGGPGSLELQTKANFNKCSDPTITFANNIDGRTEPSFVPTNRAQFTQGSALNGNIVTRAICDTLINTCDANVVALNDCQAAIAATAGLTGQAFADAFNTAVLKNA